MIQEHWLPHRASLPHPMDSLVLDDTGRLSEGLPTFLAVVLLLYVLIKKIRTPAEGFPTLITFIGSFSSVNLLMLNET